MLTLPAPVTPLNQQLDLLLPEWGGGPLHVPPEAPSIAPQVVYLHTADNSIGPRIRYNPPVSPPSEGVVS